MGCCSSCWCAKQKRCLQNTSCESLKGTFFGNYKPRSDIPNVVEKYMKKELEVEKFITHNASFPEINKAFDLMLKGEGLRCMISMEA